MQTIIDLGALSTEPVGIKDRNGTTWLADPELSANDAFWLMELRGSKDVDPDVIKRLAELVANCCRPYQSDVTPEDLLKAFRSTDLLAVLNAFLVHLGLLPTSAPPPPKKISARVAKTS